MATSEFKLPAIDSLETIEQALRTVHANRGNDLSAYATVLDKRTGALRDSAYLQVLLTWARLSEGSAINLLAGNAQDPSHVLVEACGYSTGIATLALAGGVKVLGTGIGKFTALAAAKHRISAAYEGRYDDLVKGRTVDLLTVGGAERQYLKPLFSGPSSKLVRDKYDMRSTVRALAMRAAQCAADELDARTISALATLAHELFENTQEHATKDVAGLPYRRHVELLSASWVSLGDDLQNNDLAVNSKLVSYWDTLSRSQPDRKSPQGICFSFLDSGPGMAARLTGKQYVEMSLDEERDALHRCLQMHVTSKEEKATGGGFEAALVQVASAGGFMRIRSGRHAIFRCFSPGEALDSVTEDFDDWFGSNRELLRVAGTLVSIFLPFPRPEP